MEGNVSCRNMLQENVDYGGFDLQMPVRVNHHQQPVPSHLHPRQGPAMVNAAIYENSPLTVGSSQDCDHSAAALPDYGRGKSRSDEDEDAADDPGKGKKSASPWQRVKWTDTMVRLLITAVSYISEEMAADHGSGGMKRKYVNLQKKGKWKSVSKVMAERGHFVSPQQCEDKFNDLNKRYKRLNEILGRGTSCQVVENPMLLDVMDHISAKAKEEVRKILNSKHLHYEEMCSYHNGNRLHLPPDPDLQRSLRLALRSRDDHEDIDVDQGAEVDEHGESEENQGMPRDHIHRAYGLAGNTAKCLKQNHSDEDFSFQTCLNSLDSSKNANSALQRQWMDLQNVQLAEKRLYIKTQMLELEKERLRWQRVCRKKDCELETMRMENEKMKLENERLVLEIQQKEIEMGFPGK